MVLARLAALTLVFIAFGYALTPAASDAQASAYGQYLLVLDDSGSMDQNDPDRLVVMASLAFSLGLEDGDQVMLAGLNELASGDVAGPAFVSPRELVSGRDQAEGPRPISGERATRLATFEGQTPCRGALDRARDILNAVASSGAPQTLLFLTDGACNGGAVESPDTWLRSVRSFQEDRFRFVPLMKQGRERLDRNVATYGERTGWTAEVRISFDARALLRAFADVLSFSRGLKYDDGGRIGLERTFAGARSVRILAIHEQGTERIALERVSNDAGSSIVGGPTFSHGEHHWSLRGAVDAPSETPYAARATTAGTDVLVIPVYGRLRVESVVAPCGDAPSLPWNVERAVRAGQPACAWARLVGGPGETIHPQGSFAFSIDVCADASCTSSTAMQPSSDGTFNAQLGAEFPIGRHERVFRASGGALSAPIGEARGFQSVAFGIHRVALVDAPGRPIREVDLGELPKANSDDVQLVVSGAFPAGATGRVRCEIEADAAVKSCLTCEPASPNIDLQDPFNIQVRVRAHDFCQAVSDGGEPVPVQMRVIMETGEGSVPYAVPLLAELHYAPSETIALSVVGGERNDVSVQVPAPITQREVSVAVEIDHEDLTAGAEGAQRLQADEGLLGELLMFTEATDCCSTGVHSATLVLTTTPGDTLRLPVQITVQDPGFWTCPGKQIAFWTLIAALFIFLVWVIRGFLSPAKFREGATLLWATSHDSLLTLRDGDDGYRKLVRFVETKRRFRKPGTFHLGGPEAPLPSLKRLPKDGYIEAQPGGGARFVVRGPGIQKFEESSGWVDVPPGEYPISNRITLKRDEDVFLEFRR